MRRSFGIFEALCAAAILAGLALRFHRLAEPLWYDEAVSMRSAAVPISELPRRLTGSEDSNPPLYPVLLKAWIGVAGGSDSSVHILSALIGVAFVASAGYAGFTLGSPASGLACAALAALHPWALTFSQEARAYELLILLALWSCFWLARALEKKGGWAAFSVLAAAGLYTHNYAAFLLLGQSAWIAREARGRLLRNALLAVGCALIAFAPWALVAWRQAHSLPAGYPLPDLSAIKVTLFSFGGLWVMAGRTYFHWPGFIMQPLCLAELWLAWIGFRRLRGSQPALTRGLLLVAVVSVFIPLAISSVYQLYLPGRHNVIAFAPLLLVAGLALAQAKPAPRLGALVLLLVAFSYIDAAYFSAPKSLERDIASYMAAQNRPGFKILFYPDYRKISVGRYYPRALQEGTSGLDVASPADLPAGLLVLVEETRGKFAPGQEAILSRYYRLADKKDFAETSVMVLVKKS